MKPMRQDLLFALLAAGCSTSAPSGPTPEATSPATSSATAPLVCSAADGGRPYSKYKWPFFGDLHQHTGHSLDAYSFGTRALPADAYLFAKQEETITVGAATNAPSGPAVTIDRPLDFLAVTDHSEWMGITQGCVDPTSAYYWTLDCIQVRSKNPAAQSWVFAHIGGLDRDLCSDSAPPEYAAVCAAERRSVWEDEQEAAANAYEPCRFTSFVAYEWTNRTGHRNVIFKGASVPQAPIDSITATTSLALWNALDTECTQAAGCKVITPAHNTNMSGGTQLALPSTPADVPQMVKYQPVVEIYQHKGTSECYFAGATSQDPLCYFEQLNPLSAANTPQAYVRTALENGLLYQLENPGADNPLHMGFIAATDDHNATPGHVQESDYAGHAGRIDDSPAKRLTGESSYNGSGGLTVAWAEQNTRESIFSAFERRETYATSGPRITLRFYATSNPSACTPDFPNTIIDDRQAIPMGGSFGRAMLPPGANVPHFALAAWPDPLPQISSDGTTRVAALSKLQIIKAHGKADAQGNASIIEDPPVDIAIDPYGGCVEWDDPSFDPTERAFYYVRALQELTWRWSHFDCQALPSTPGCEPGGRVDRAEHERAWSSPIWFEP
jgi:hypothetical protein